MVLAAGAGLRLRPLTLVRPKPLCPLGDRPLVDHAVDRVRGIAVDVAVNVHHGRAMFEEHLAGRVHLSIEDDEALGTAGALGRLREWIDGRPVVAVNGDTWTDAPLASLLDGWDGERTRLMVVGDAGLSRPRLAGAMMPWAEVAGLAAEASGLWERRWASADAEGRLDWVRVDAAFADCGTPAAYLAANLAVSGGASVLGEGAVVAGSAERSVIWPDCIVERGEHLVDAIRYGAHRTVLVR